MKFELEGKKLFSIGNLPLDKYDLRLLVTQQKGKWMSGISKKLDYIIQGEKPTAKQLEKAKASGVPLISYAEFRKLVNEEFTRFGLEEVSGEMAPDALLEVLQEKNWALFRQVKGREALGDLVALLRAHEATHGVTAVHHYCTKQLQGEYCLELIHPFHHTGEIRNHDISPDGKFLATSCDLNREFEKRKAIVQIWDIEMGKPINQFSIQGGVGTQRSDEIMSGLQWSPDSKLIGMNKNLNGIAVYKPNGARLSEAYITNGIAYAIGFAWAMDSERVMIQWPFYEKLGISEDEDPEENVTWMPAEVEPPRGTNHRESEKQCVPGRESDHPVLKKRRALQQLPAAFQGLVEHEKGNVYYQSPSGLVVVKPGSVSFVREDGSRQDYPQYDWNPIGSRQKTQRQYSLSPLFPVSEDRAQYGKIIGDEALFVPADYPVAKYMGASACRTHGWPLSWFPSIPIRDSDEEI